MEAIDFLYNYCTQFIINLANLTQTSYYEVNFWLFGVIYPFTLLVFCTIFIWQKKLLKKYRDVG